MKAAWYYPNDKHINQWRAQNRPVLSTDFFFFKHKGKSTDKEQSLQEMLLENFDIHLSNI